MNAAKRQLCLDTETTGLSWEHGHKIIEIGIVELIGRRETGVTFHRYIYPDREIEDEAFRKHNLDLETLLTVSDGKRFVDIYQELVDFINGDELVIHNAAFDMGFLDSECRRINKPVISGTVVVTDTLIVANNKHPKMRNNLDALCSRYSVDNSNRDYHGALLDSQLLAKVYVEMTRAQNTLSLSADNKGAAPAVTLNRSKIEYAKIPSDVASRLVVVVADENERHAHASMVSKIAKSSGDNDFSF